MAVRPFNYYVDAYIKILGRITRWSPAQYVIAWIASWVEEFGIDGFRCDIVENVHLNRWKELGNACNAALDKWRANHKGKPGAGWTDQFYMTGDFENASIDYKPDYSDVGFSSMVNCFFPKHGDLDGIVYTWQVYADSVQTYHNWHPFNYLNNSYHREADMNNMIDCATTLLLSPGVAQIFYGDETGRKLSEARLNVDSDQAFRSDMNWNSVDQSLLEHFRRLGKIRHDNPVIGTGKQRTLDTHTCLRYNDTDTLFIVLKPQVDKPIHLYGVYPEGAILVDQITGESAVVRGGEVRFPTYINRMAVIRMIGETLAQ